ncbi:hypothetical protein ACL02T_19200 [Pseudonocardia sp. RS010]|uniref:hypothetical protein n=1 Tax=Pseudonocardia sp. RS010 TaxID=3385979 RepID=UPI00399F16A8
MSRPDDPRPADHATPGSGPGRTGAQPAGAQPTAAQPTAAQPSAAQPTDAEPIDAEIVETAPMPVAPAAPDTPAATGYTDEGVPTLDYVRDKIEGRAATAAGWQELTGDSEAGREVEERFAEREQKAKDKLEEIRRSLGR